MSDGSSRPSLVEILVSHMGQGDESKVASIPGVRTTDEEAWCRGSSLLPIVDDAGQLSQPRATRAAIRSEGTCETDVAAEHQEHASPPASGVILERKSELHSKLWTSSHTATAGCTKTRRSTSSSYVMLGGHLFAASATTQHVVATNSGEADFSALTKSALRALGAVAWLLIWPRWSSHVFEWEE